MKTESLNRIPFCWSTAVAIKTQSVSTADVALDRCYRSVAASVATAKAKESLEKSESAWFE